MVVRMLKLMDFNSILTMQRLRHMSNIKIEIIRALGSPKVYKFTLIRSGICLIQHKETK